MLLAADVALVIVLLAMGWSPIVGFYTLAVGPVFGSALLSKHHAERSRRIRAILSGSLYCCFVFGTLFGFAAINRFDLSESIRTALLLTLTSAGLFVIGLVGTRAARR